MSTPVRTLLCRIEDEQNLIYQSNRIRRLQLHSSFFAGHGCRSDISLYRHTKTGKNKRYIQKETYT
jgi:hypothetical protein